MKRFAELACCVALSAVPGLAYADSITVYSNTSSSNVFDNSGNTTIAIQQFDASLGTLTGASVDFDGISEPQLQGLNLNPTGPTTVTGSTTVNYTLSGSGLTAILASASSGMQSVTITGGIGSTASSMASVHFINQLGAFTDVSALVGSGVFDFSLNELFTTSGSTVSGIGAVGGTGTSDLGVTVTYTYVPSAVPEPATFAIMGAGLLGLIATRRRRA